MAGFYSNLPPEVQKMIVYIGTPIIILLLIMSYFLFKDWNETFLYEGDAIEITSSCTTAPTKIFVRNIVVGKTGTMIADVNNVNGEFPLGHMFTETQNDGSECIVGQLSSVDVEYREKGNVDRVTIRWPEHFGHTAVRLKDNEIRQPIPTRITQFFSMLMRGGAATTP